MKLEFDIKTGIRNILQEYSLLLENVSSLIRSIRCLIRLQSDNPMYCSPRRLSYRDKEDVQTIISDLLSKDDRPSNSPYASPIVLVKKKSA